jgi:quercetin dioxygenase-like cupin family protein
MTLKLGWTAVVLLLLVGTASSQQNGIQRKPLLQHDGPPGYQTLVTALEFSPGAREPRHTHPGQVTGNILEGTLTLEHEGRPTTSYKPGEVFHVDAGKVHSIINDTSAPLKYVATLVAEKGKPPSSPAR